MKIVSSVERRPVRRPLAIALVAALGVGLAAPPRAALAHGGITAPPVPDKLGAPEGDVAFFVGHATGTQNYVCVPSGAGVAWSLFTPQATLFGDNDRQVTTHFFSPNPEEDNVVRATWEDSKDTSTVWGRVKEMSTDEHFVARGAIAWLLVEIKGRQAGPTGGGKLLGTTVIQRLNTAGGLAPATGCATAADVGARAFQPYTADYFFYEHPGRDED